MKTAFSKETFTSEVNLQGLSKYHCTLNKYPNIVEVKLTDNQTGSSATFIYKSKNKESTTPLALAERKFEELCKEYNLELLS